MSATTTGLRGRTYWCPICGAEITVLAGAMGDFHPVCCNLPMKLIRRAVVFYWCPLCGAEVALLCKGSDDFRPLCCSQRMRRKTC